MNRSIPSPLIALVSEIFSSLTHAQLDNRFFYANAPGEPPDDTKTNKINKWLFRCNNDPEVDALGVLGKFIEDYMEVELPEEPLELWGQTANFFGGMFASPDQIHKANRERIVRALGKHGLCYYSGGIIRQSGTSGPTKSLEEMLRSKDLIGVEIEFARAIGNIESDPPSSLTAACAIIESLCKFYIEEAGLEMPKDQTVKPLWNTVRVHLGVQR